MGATPTLLIPDDAHNQKLLQNAHPLNWANPKAGGRYNLVVVGAGTAGLVSAAGAATLGARVALIEKHLMGGDCLNYGCVPSKALIRAARAADAISEASAYGVDSGSPMQIDFGKVMERVRSVRAEISVHDSVERFSRLGADVFMGAARFSGRDSVEVNGQRLTFSRAIIATGARAATLPIPGLAEAGFLTNETVFSLTERPRRLVVIGAGPLGCELAQAFRRLGSEVTLVSRGSRFLPREDPEAADILKRRFEEERIQFVLGARVLRVDCAGGLKTVVVDRGRGQENIAGDEILLGIGRAPNIERLNLQVAGVEFDERGVKVDDRLRTTNRKIYAAGDVCSSYKFTHAAEAMARIALQNALFFGRKRTSSLVIPWCTYTHPEVARVGLTALEARQRGYQVETFSLPLTEVDRAILDGETEGFGRVHVERRTGRILGATLVSRHAGESIGEIVLAMNKGIALGALSGVIHPYPTQAEVIKRLGDAFMRSRLKPWMRRLLRRYFSYGR
jgi:pyruvate/2-oxoglutarate dehydrogenase complex dihydrolipoamide dehydrogenase (E3) component